MKDGTTQGSWEGRWKEQHLIVMTFGLLEPLDSTVFVVTSALELFSYMWQFSSVQSLSCVWLFVTPSTAARQASLSLPTPGAYSNSCPSSQWCHPTISSSVIPFSSCLQSFPSSGSFPLSQFFASGCQSIGVFSFSISPSNEYSGLISFRIDWFDLLAIQETLKNLLQH